MKHLPEWCSPVAGIVIVWALALVLVPWLPADESESAPVMKADLADWLKTSGVAKARKHWEWQVKDLAHSLEAAKRGTISADVKDFTRAGPPDNSPFTDDRFWFHDLTAMTKHVKRLESSLAEAKAKLLSGEPLPPDLRVDLMRVGAVGRLRCVRGTFERARVSQAATAIRSGNGRTLCEMGGVRFWVEGEKTGVFDTGDVCYVVVASGGAAAVLDIMD